MSSKNTSNNSATASSSSNTSNTNPNNILNTSIPLASNAASSLAASSTSLFKRVSNSLSSRNTQQQPSTSNNNSSNSTPNANKSIANNASAAAAAPKSLVKHLSQVDQTKNASPNVSSSQQPARPGSTPSTMAEQGKGLLGNQSSNGHSDKATQSSQDGFGKDQLLQLTSTLTKKLKLSEHKRSQAESQIDELKRKLTFLQECLSYSFEYETDMIEKISTLSENICQLNQKKNEQEDIQTSFNSPSISAVGTPGSVVSSSSAAVEELPITSHPGFVEFKEMCDMKRKEKAPSRRLSIGMGDLMQEDDNGKENNNELEESERTKLIERAIKAEEALERNLKVHMTIIESMERDLSKLRAQNEKNENALNQVTDTCASQKNTITQLQKNMEDKEAKIKELEVTLEEKSLQVASLAPSAMAASQQKHVDELLAKEKEHSEEISRLKQELDEARQEASYFKDKSEKTERDLQITKEFAKKEIESLTAKHTQQLHDLKKEMVSMEIRLTEELEKKEEIIVQSTAKISELEIEMSDGKSTERQMMKLAKQQAQREKEMAANNQLITRLKAEIQEYERHRISANQLAVQLKEENAMLKAVARREGINIEYLRNVILKFMSFDISSVERSNLVQVIANLLEFSPEETDTAIKLFPPTSDVKGGWLSTALIGHVLSSPTSLAVPISSSSSLSASMSAVGARRSALSPDLMQKKSKRKALTTNSAAPVNVMSLFGNDPFVVKPSSPRAQASDNQDGMVAKSPAHERRGSVPNVANNGKAL